MKKDEKAAFTLNIPETGVKFQIINKCSQLADLINTATTLQQNPSDSASGSNTTSQVPVSKIHNNFANHPNLRQTYC